MEEPTRKRSEQADHGADEPETAEVSRTEVNSVENIKKSLEEANDKYIRLYADFENYKKITARNKEELLKYAHEDLISDLLTVIDHLELALQHTSNTETSSALAEGVNLTLKELRTILEKYGLVTIESIGKPFDPFVHHAMSQIETEEADENSVVKEFRKGYILKDRVLRAALVGVAKKQTRPDTPGSKSDQQQEASNNKI